MGVPTKVQIPSISIHALREEGDSRIRRAETHQANFYPRPPRGGRLVLHFLLLCARYFYPRPPRGGRPLRFLYPMCICTISIHALREEGDDTEQTLRPEDMISIHALREEGDSMPLRAYAKIWNISIHALREEGDKGYWG